MDSPGTSGTLKTKISLGRTPMIVHTGPFYLMQQDLPEPAELTGANNLMAYHGLEHTLNKLSTKRVKEELSAFLPTLPGDIDEPGFHDNSSLRSVYEKPPIGGKELLPLTGSALTGFRLHPGPLPEHYRPFSEPSKKKKNKKNKKNGEETPLESGGDVAKENNEETKKKDKKKKRKKKRKY